MAPCLGRRGYDAAERVDPEGRCARSSAVCEWLKTKACRFPKCTRLTKELPNAIRSRLPRVPRGRTLDVDALTIPIGESALEVAGPPAAAQALDLRGRRYGTGTERARSIVRGAVSTLREDRALHSDHQAIVDLMKSGAIARAVADVLEQDNRTPETEA